VEPKDGPDDLVDPRTREQRPERHGDVGNLVGGPCNATVISTPDARCCPAMIGLLR
jgi:hypothetical protein